MRTPRSPVAPSWVEIDLAAVRHNLGVVARHTGPHCRAWAVVKANAYGHGAVPVARAALEGGAGGLAVASVTEALKLRREGLQAPVLVFSAGDPRTAAQVVRHDLIHTACEPRMVAALAQAARRLGRPARVHLKVDTGMGRLGVLPEEAVAFARAIVEQPGLRLEGVFSHLATAEESDPGYAEEQLARFRRVLAGLASAGVPPGMRHLASSAAVARFPHMHLDAVRVGLLTYGIQPGPGNAPRLDLRPALTWRTRLAFRHRLPAGGSVSYGRTFRASSDMIVGVLPVGYADGYPRHASNRAYVLVGGRPCPLLGRVCMDHVIVDLGPAPEARVGDEVVLLGRQGGAEIAANHLAAWAGTCLHEVTTVIGPRVARRYRDPGQTGRPGAPRER